MNADQPTETLGQTIDRLGTTSPRTAEVLAGGGLVTEVMVLVRHIDADGQSGLSTAWSEGMDWMVRRAMTEVAADMERQCTHDGQQS